MRRVLLYILTGFIALYVAPFAWAADFPTTTVATIEILGNREISTREILKAIQFQA